MDDEHITPLSSSYEFDIVIFGATGYTGSLIVKDFVDDRRYHSKKWAIAGRREYELRSLHSILPNKESIGVIIADAMDIDSLLEMTRKTKILINCVGPFCLYGKSVVEACLTTQTHYIDITGEKEYVEQVIDDYNCKAEERNTLIIPACGFDSTLADIGTRYCMMNMVDKNSLANAISMYIKITDDNSSMVFSMSHGTFETISHIAQHPFNWIGWNECIPRYNTSIKGWVLPNNAVADPVVAERTEFLSTSSARNFHFEEFIVFRSFLHLCIASLLMMGIILLASNRIGLRILDSINTPGGPTREHRDTAGVIGIFVGQDGKQKIETRVYLPEVYKATAMFIREITLCILDKDEEPLQMNGGVATPVSVIGDRIIDVMKDAGVRFSVGSTVDMNEEEQAEYYKHWDLFE